MKKEFKSLDTGNKVNIKEYIEAEWNVTSPAEADVVDSAPQVETPLEAHEEEVPQMQSSVLAETSVEHVSFDQSASSVVMTLPEKTEEKEQSNVVANSTYRTEVEVNNIPKKGAAPVSKKKKRKSIPKELARSFLNDVANESQFWLKNGTSLRNVKDLSAALLTMPPEVYTHHVNTDRNDFYNWVNEVVKDKTMANKVRKSKTRYDMAKKVASRINFLEKQGENNG